MKKRAKDLGEEKKANDEVYRKFQEILNKLTPQKFQTLAEQALELPIDTEERLEGVVDKVYTMVSLLQILYNNVYLLHVIYDVFC